MTTVELTRLLALVTIWWVKPSKTEMTIAASTVSRKTIKNIGTEKRFLAILRKGEPGETKQVETHTLCTVRTRLVGGYLIGVIR